MNSAKKVIKVFLVLTTILAAVSVYKAKSFLQGVNQKTALASTLSGKSIKEFLAQKVSADATGTALTPKACSSEGDNK